jgi:hypothetical protein
LFYLDDKRRSLRNEAYRTTKLVNSSGGDESKIWGVCRPAEWPQSMSPGSKRNALIKICSWPWWPLTTVTALYGCLSSGFYFPAYYKHFSLNTSGSRNGLPECIIRVEAFNFPYNFCLAGRVGGFDSYIYNRMRHGREIICTGKGGTEYRRQRGCGRAGAQFA